MSTILEKKIDKILSALDVSDWVPERDGFLSLSSNTLANLRENSEHNEGWRYTAFDKKVDSMNRAVRRNIIWRKSYLISLFQMQ